MAGKCKGLDEWTGLGAGGGDGGVGPRETHFRTMLMEYREVMCIFGAEAQKALRARRRPLPASLTEQVLFTDVTVISH